MAELEAAMRKHLEREAFERHNFIELESVEPDRAVMRLNIRPESKNAYGMVHGGAFYTLADDATGTAASTDGRFYVTQSGTLHFLHNQPEGLILADARIRHRGKATCLVDVDITGEDGKLLATGEFTFFCVDPKQVKSKAK